MNDKSTLEQKYRKSRELGYIPRRYSYISPLKYDGNSEHRRSNVGRYNVDNQPTYASHIPIHNNRQENRSQYTDSPIKSLSVLPYTPSKLRPNKLYKIFNDTTPRNKGILIKNKDRKYNSKWGKGSALDRQKGIFGRLRSFLTKFSLSNHEHDDTNLRLLRNSAKSVLNVKEQPEYREQKRVWFEQNESPLVQEPVFEVPSPSTNIVMSSNHQSELMKSQFDELHEIIKRERLKNNSIREHYQKQIELLENASEKRMEELMKQISGLQGQVNLNADNIEKSKIDELEISLIKEHEKFLINQKTQERQLEKERQRVQELERDLHIQKDKLEVELEKLKKKRTTVLENGSKVSSNKDEFDELDDKRRRLLHDIKSIKPSTDVLIRRLNLNKQKYQQRRKLLLKEKLNIQSDLQSNEHEYVMFFEELIEISQSMLHRNDSHMQFLLKDIEILLESLNMQDLSKYLARNFQRVEHKFNEYLKVFQAFKQLYNRQEYQTITIDYSIESLMEIKGLFIKLHDSFGKSIYKKRNRIQGMNHTISSLQLNLVNATTSGKNYRILAKTFQRRSDILNEMKVLNGLLISLSLLLKQLDEILILLEHSPYLQ